jgi:mRNA interferase RelE/StbE
MYGLRILDAAASDLEQLDSSVGARIVKRLQWLAENFESIRPQPLEGNFSGFYKFRVGDYRVIYEILSEEESIVIHAIGHRREIYRSR